MTTTEKPKPRLDGTINLPTLLALLGFMVAQGLLPNGTSDAADDLKIHASTVHADAVRQETYKVERAHARESMERIEAKLDALAVEVRSAP